LSSGRYAHTVTLLPNGKVLVAGGFSTTFLASAELYDAGLGFSASWQPQITTFTSPLGLGGNLILTGSGFRGISGASSGNTQNSSGDYPVVQLRSMENGQTLFLHTASWPATSYISGAVSGLSPGWAMATMFVNGIPGPAGILILRTGATVTLGSLNQPYDGSPKNATATTSPFGLTVNFTYDGSATAPTAAGSYTVVGTISDTNYVGNGTGTLVITLAALPAGVWTSVAPMTAPRWGSASGEINGKIYIAGGYNGSHTTTVDAYDPVANTWSALPNLSGVHTGSAFGVIDGKLYLAAGTGSSTFTGTVEAYDPVSNTWSAKASIPTQRGSGAGGVLNGLLYVAGGYNGGGTLSTVEAYNPVTNTWSAKASMSGPRQSFGLGAVNGILYAIGGYDQGTGQALNTVEAYDPVANTWTARTPMPSARIGVAVTVLNGTLYVIGGADPTNATVYATVEAYDPVLNVWTTLAPLNVAAVVPNAVTVNDRIYVSGGYTSGGASPVSTTEYFTSPVSTGIADQATTNSATLHGSISPAGNTVPTHFEYGTTSAYGSSVGGKMSAALASVQSHRH